VSAELASDIASRIHSLPALPAVVVELLCTLEQEDLNVRALADKIALDQGLTAKTLRLANSSFYGMPNKVATIHQAITILGLSSMRTLVTAAAVLDQFPQAGLDRFDFPAFWRHSIGAGLCAQALARHLDVNQDTAFLAGLLHDIGRLVLVTHFADRFERVQARAAELDCYPIEAEQAVLGIDHAAVGGALAAHWQFPPRIVSAIVHHHDPDAAGAGALATLAHVADCIAHGLDLSGAERDLVPPLSPQAWEVVNLGPSALEPAPDTKSPAAAPRQ
jgi:putative nucleotidyltransferase with HDIG domain